MNETMAKFGYPGSLVAEYEHWAVLLRPQQATLGALVLACREPATAFAQISPGAFAELPSVIKDIETSLSSVFAYEKINYLMLMMVDPHVHFHVVPRYSRPQSFAGIDFADAGWPKLPDLASAPQMDASVLEDLRQNLAGKWNRGAA